MLTTKRASLFLAGAVVALVAITGERAYTQADGPNAAPNPYRVDEGWAKPPFGRGFGSTIGLNVDIDGKSMWIYDRCGGNSCEGSKVAPLIKYESTGKPVAAIGIGLTNFPHGLFVDREGNLWITDGRGKGDIGHSVLKLNPEGKVLMTIGTPGKGGDGVNQFNAPSDVIVAPNGDIFVADGHGEKTNARIVKLNKEGKYVKAWGKEGKGQGEFDQPHGLAMDSQGRLFVADRANSRIQIFDQEGRFLTEWKQFGRPSGVQIDKNDVIYVADSQSTERNNPGFQQGIRIGSAKDGKVTAFIPETVDLGALEGVGYDDAGNVYAGYTNKMNLKRFIKK